MILIQSFILSSFNGIIAILPQDTYNYFYPPALNDPGDKKFFPAVILGCLRSVSMVLRR